MTQANHADQFFALLEDEDVDFLGANTHPDVPVLTYRWSKNDTVAQVPLNKLIEVAKLVMEELGLRRVVSEGHHLRGDTADQRVKMSVLSSSGHSMYILMTAGMPGEREKAQKVNRKIALRLEERICNQQSGQSACQSLEGKEPRE